MRFCNKHAVEFLICLALMACLAASGADAGSPKPEVHIGLNAAAAAAEADQSLVLLVFSAKWCEPCKLLEKNTLKSAEFLDHAGALHIADIDVDADNKTAQLFGVEAVPTLVLLTPDKKIIQHQTGYIAASNLTEWINQGRQRNALGQWEGNVPGSQLERFVTKASSDGLETEDIAKLVLLLDERDPGDRAQCELLILGQRDRAVQPLVDALGDSYLGIRIEAAQLLHKLAPDSPEVDPWQSPADLKTAIASVRQWWTKTRTLPAPAVHAALDPAMKSSIDSAIADLRGDDPHKRTDAMAQLVAAGEPALTSLRAAITNAGHGSDARTTALLEDVRWAILIPDALEQRAGHVRNALARGASSDRQAAADRLGSAGKSAIPALSELVNDSDSLVIESSVRALSKIGGTNSVAAMGGLLRAGDSNLRMTAAQALGHTKKKQANALLLEAVADPNEVVACTALSALIEINQKDEYAYNTSSVASVPEEISSTIKKALADSRWRVRAAASDAAGKLHLSGLVPDPKALLRDGDGFVVQSAMKTLGELSAAPSVGEMADVVKRLPSLRTEAVETIFQSSSDDADAAITNLYNGANAGERLKIISALGGGRLHNSVKVSSNAWSALMQSAIASQDSRIRLEAGGVLVHAPKEITTAMITPLLGDESQAVRIAGAAALVTLLGGNESENIYIQEDFESSNGSRRQKTNAPVAAPETIRGWHNGLVKSPDLSTNFLAAVAIYLTGDATNDLPVLSAALARFGTNDVSDMKWNSAVRAVLKKLPWPAGKDVLDKLTAAPALYLLAAQFAGSDSTNVADYLWEPARFKAAAEAAPSHAVAQVLPNLMVSQNYVQTPAWTLVAATPRAREVASALGQSANPIWKTAAIYALGVNDPEKSIAIFEEAARDTNAWVRRAALQGFARAIKDRAELEKRVVPMLSDTNEHVALAAAIALLEPEVRSVASLYSSETFRYEDVQSYQYNQSSGEADRPLAPLDAKPAFLETVRRKWSEADAKSAPVWMLLLAQYGQFDALERQLTLPLEPDSKFGEEEGGQDAVYAAIALSHDVKYVSYLLNMARDSKDQMKLQAILKAARGMSGKEVRQLRVEVNKLIRQASTGGFRID